MKDDGFTLADAVRVSHDVRDFYQHHPYPPPVDSLDKYRQRWDDPRRRRADYHLFFPDRPYSGEQSILIAGCGTSQAAKHAMRWPAARVTGVDFSATSVSSTQALKRKYKLDNLDLHQLAIERVGELNTTFDHIVCTGVLHHLPAPGAGLSALRHALKPDGAMHVMVYAPYGRAGVYMLQDFCKRIGVRATQDDIRDLIKALKALPPGHPLESLLREAPDFRNEAALADALLNPCDRAYSVPQLFEFLDASGLRFGRWIRQAPYSIHCGVMAQLPQASRMAQLPVEGQYAAAELFRGTMIRHSVIAYRDDAPGGLKPTSFAGDAWLSYVPIRLPDTISVRERLPPGAAAVLINQSHTYRDIYLPIDTTEARLFEAIDGARTIGAIANETLPLEPSATRHDPARAFFERLWWHDQIVFDTSATQ
jgi:SAM-dependent methyltransferase